MQPFLIYRCIFPEGRAMHELKKNTHKHYTVTTTAVLRHYVRRGSRSCCHKTGSEEAKSGQCRDSISHTVDELKVSSTAH